MCGRGTGRDGFECGFDVPRLWLVGSGGLEIVVSHPIHGLGESGGLKSAATPNSARAVPPDVTHRIPYCLGWALSRHPL